MPGKKRRKKKAARTYNVKKTSKSQAAKPSLSSTTKSRANGDFLNKAGPAILCVAIIIIVGALAYLNSFHGPFVFDDDTNIARNKSILGFGTALTESFRSRAIGYITFALNYKINGLDVVGFHVFNLAVHLAVALLVFWLVIITLKTPFFKGSRLAESRLIPLIIALFAALIFVTHPVQTQAVTYIVQRFTSLATLFYLLSLIMYAKWRLAKDVPEGHSIFGYIVTINPEISRGVLYTISLFSVFLAMQTKEIAFTLPVGIALWEFSFCEGRLKKRILNLLPFFIMVPMIPFVLMRDKASLTSAAGATDPPAVFDYFFTQLRVIVTYLRLLVFPAGQNLDYDYPVYSSFFDLNVLLSTFFLIAFLALGVLLWRLSGTGVERAPLRLAAFGILWFFITISVESSFISIAAVIFEHRLYLPSVGLIITLVAVVAWATGILKGRVPSLGKAAVALGAVVVIVLAVATYERNKVWSDPLILWGDAASKSPEKYRPHYNLGYYYQEMGQSEKAEAEFKTAIEFDTKQTGALRHLGAIYTNKKLYDEAIYYFNKAIEINPKDYKSHTDLGSIYYMQGRYDLAYAEYITALTLNPNDSSARKNIELLRDKTN